MDIKVDWHPWVKTIDVATPIPRAVCMVSVDEHKLLRWDFFTLLSESYKQVIEQIREYYRQAFGRTMDWADQRISSAVEEIGRAIDPFRLPLHPQLGFPVRIAVADQYPHLVDELIQFATGDQLEVRVERRPDLSDKTRLLSSVGDMVWDALGLRPHLNNVAWLVILAVLDAIADDKEVKEWIRTKDFVADRTLAQMEQELITRGEAHKIGELGKEVAEDAGITREMRQRLLSKTQPDLSKILGHYVMLPLLARDEIRAYQEFYTTYGRERVRGTLVQVSYPSKLWHWLAQSGDDDMILEIGAVLTKYRLIQHRLQETKHSELQVSDFTALQGLDLLYPDALLSKFIGNELLALRFRLLGILSYPETFLKIRLNEDDLHYSNMVAEKLRLSYSPYLSKTKFMNKLSDCLQTPITTHGGGSSPNSILDAYSTVRYPTSCINIGQALTEIFGVGAFGRFPPDINDVISIHSSLAGGNATLKDVSVFVFNYLRNALIHGRDFQVRDSNDWSKAVLCFQSKSRQYEADYEGLAICYHLLPIVLLRLMDVT